MSQIACGAKLWGELPYEGPEQHLGNFNGGRGCGSDPSQSLSPSIMLMLSLPFLYCLPLQTLLSLHHILSHTPPTLLFGTRKRALHKKSENMGCTTICKFHYYLPMWLWTRYFTDLKLSYFICKTGKKQTIFLRFDFGFNGKKGIQKQVGHFCSLFWGSNERKNWNCLVSSQVPLTQAELLLLILPVHWLSFHTHNNSDLPSLANVLSSSGVCSED